MKIIPTVSCAVFALVVCGCVYDDLSVHYKECSPPEHACPGDMVCVERPVSLTDLEGHCHTQADAPLCEAETFCSQNGNWVEACDSDSFSSTVLEDCDDTDLTCNPDTALCATSCTEEPDCEPQTCDTGTGLCRPFPDCEPGQCEALDFCCSGDQICVGGASCVPNPEESAKVDEGSADLNCDTPPLGSGPGECILTGRVYFFPLTGSDETPGLKVILRPAGDPDDSLAEVDVVADADGKGQYRIEQVATNQTYDLEIEANDELGTVTTIHAGLTIRADRLENGDTFSRALSAMKVSEFDDYTSNLITGLDQTGRCLVIGRVTDCSARNPKALANATVALAVPPVPPGRLYYFQDDEGVLVPDGAGALSATTVKGYYAAAGVPACRNLVGFAALEGSSTFPLGSVSFTAKPGSAVIANLPVPADRLPE